MPTTRVFVVDDHPFFRKGVVSWLEYQNGFVCCGEAESIAAARRSIPESRPDVLLLDLQLKDGDGLALAKEFSEQYPEMRILVVSYSEEDVFAHRALLAGARGYIMKSEAPETVLEAIQRLMRGELYFSRTMSARLLHNLFPDPASKERELARLSDRELQVFQMLGARCRNGEIAAALKISPKTVDTYRENLKQKLGLFDADALVEAATFWVRNGRLPPAASRPKTEPRTRSRKGKES
jgi:DNA-binding NarL/FixJ family response regulator